MATVSEQFVANARTAVVRDGEYLLVRRAEAEEHAAGELALIGGTVEEASAEAVLEGTLEREVREEVGVETTDHRYVRSNAFVTDTGAPCVTVTFRSRYTGGEPGSASPRRWRQSGGTRPTNRSKTRISGRGRMRHCTRSKPSVTTVSEE
jgi:8-oxo-dGTP diphosphatase